jgi:hypothetical protein
MKTWTRSLAGFAASIVLLHGMILAQNAPAGQQKPAGCSTAGVPEKVEGQIAKVEPDQGKVTVRGSNGETWEFQASKETLQRYKVGDHIQAKLRTAPNCKPSTAG